MNKYEATFLVPAQVRITVMVEAQGQELGLAGAYDALQSAMATSGCIVSMDKDAADLQGFLLAATATPAAGTAPPSPHDGREDFTVVIRSRLEDAWTGGARCGYADAKKLVDNTVGDPLGPIASAAVLKVDGQVAYVRQAARGGWEVHATPKDLTQPKVENSWIADQATARKRALGYAVSKDFSRVQVFDFTDRKAGPVSKMVFEA